MYVVAINRKAVIGYKQVDGTITSILPGRRRIKLFGKRDTGRSALITFNGNKYAGTVGDEAEPGDRIQLFIFPDQAVYTSFPEGDVWNIDAQTVPEGRTPVKDAGSANKAYASKYGMLALKLAASGLAGVILWVATTPAIGGSLFAGVALQSAWRFIASGPIIRLYKTDCRKLTYSGRCQE